MAKFTTTTTYEVKCPVCDSDHVVKIGKQRGQQRYRCRGCKKDFRANGKAQGRRMDAELMGSAIRDFYTGKSYKQIAEGLKEEYDLEKEPSKATIYEWVKTHTDEAVKEMKNHKAKTSGKWVADEMQVDVGGRKMWLWNVMDSETRYILASHLTPRRDANAARVVLRKAALAADKPPKTITTDKLRSYLRAVKDVLPEADHKLSEGIRAELNNNLSERVQGTFRDRIKTLRGMDSRETGQRYLDGWVITYNNFRKHESLGNKPPALKAQVNPPFKEWADVVKGGAALQPVKVEEAGARPKLKEPETSPRKPRYQQRPAARPPAPPKKRPARMVRPAPRKRKPRRKAHPAVLLRTAARTRRR